MTRPILVFGCRGQLGCEILARAREYDIPVLGRTHDEADITDERVVAGLVAKTRPRLVVNAAAYTAVDRAEAEPRLAELVNVVGARSVSAAAAAHGVPIIHISTDYVFDGQKRGAYVETDPIAPLGVYGRTKAKGEEKVRQVAPRHVILRTSWVYGRYGSNFLKTILRLARERPTLRIVADQRGCPTATSDLAEAIFTIDKALSAPDRSVWGTYHFTGGGATTWHGFAEAIVAAQAPRTGLRPPVTAISTSDYPTPAQRPANSELNSGRFAATFGYHVAAWQQRVVEAVETLLLETKEAL